MKHSRKVILAVAGICVACVIAVPIAYLGLFWSGIPGGYSSKETTFDPADGSGARVLMTTYVYRKPFADVEVEIDRSITANETERSDSKTLGFKRVYVVQGLAMKRSISMQEIHTKDGVPMTIIFVTKTPY